MRQVLLVRFGEVHLKGQNRPFFMKKLTENVRKAVASAGATVWLSDSRIYVADMDVEEASERVRRVFGIHSVSPAWEMDKDFELIAAKAVELSKDLRGTFKVMARRSDKKFPMTSMEMNAEIGGRILDANPNLTVDVHKPMHEVSVEVRDKAYVYVGEIMAVGGLPMGTGGKGMLLLSGGIDSPVAGFQLMRRYMMRIANRIARQHGAQALITGENLGQVASQTMEALGCTDAVCDLPVFRPLIGLDKLEITEQAIKIGTYETSILPYEDCCTVFTPRHPTTKPKVEQLIEAEKALDTEALVAEAVANTESVYV